MAQVQHDVTLYYEDHDITGSVDIIECVCRDVSGGGCDCLDIKVDHADKWLRWNPRKNEKIRVTRSGYDTKNLFVNTLVPEDGSLRILATGTKCAPLPKRWQAYEDQSLSSIAALCASECGMASKLYGLNGEIKYDYLLREGMTAPAFLSLLMQREGACLKALDGSFAAIGIAYAQALEPMHELKLEADLADAKYIDRRDERWGSVRIQTPFCKGTARDADVDGKEIAVSNLPADNDGQAYRWAKGILLSHNRQCEALQMEMGFNAGYTAMVRVDVNASSDVAGQWIIDSVEQDLIDGRTRAKMLRCITSIK